METIYCLSSKETKKLQLTNFEMFEQSRSYAFKSARLCESTRYTVEHNLDLASRIKLCVLVNEYSLVTKIITDLFTTQIFNYYFISFVYGTLLYKYKFLHKR